MVGDELSRRQDRALHRAFESAVLAQFPNPERKDCPGTGTLRAIANKRISMRDPALAHVGQCSPCLLELIGMRHAAHRHTVAWRIIPAAAVALVFLMAVGYYGLRIRTSPTDPQLPRVARVLDLTAASVPRTGTHNSAIPPLELRRGLLTLTIKLPTGSEAGVYEVAVETPNHSTVAKARGQARIERGITSLIVDIDTNSVPTGDYALVWRLLDFDSRSYPLRIQ